MNKATVYYFLAALLLALGAYLLVEGYDDFSSGEDSTAIYVMRGLGPLLMAIAMISFARQARTGGKV